MRNLLISSGLILALVAPATMADSFDLLTGVNAGKYPGANRTVSPSPGPGFPGTFNDGDRLAGTGDDGPAISFFGVGSPMYSPNQFGALSFMLHRGSIPAGPGMQVPFLGIDFLGGPRLDLDGDLNNGSRSLIPVSGQTPVEIGGRKSGINLSIDYAAGVVTLKNIDATGNNEGAPGVSAGTATVLATLSGTSSNGALGGPINPGVDTRVGTVTPFLGSGDSLQGVYRITGLGYEIWQDSIEPTSSSASTLGTFQYFGSMRGWVISRGPSGFPTLAGHGLGGTLWPQVNASAVGQTFVTANGLAGGSAIIAGGVNGDNYSAAGNGGLALTAFGGDLGAYIDAVVMPHVPATATRVVFLESAGWGINNSTDPVFLDTDGYDIVLIGANCTGDIDGSGAIDLSDLAQLLAGYGTFSGGPNFNPDNDVNGDGIVDLGDLAQVLAVYGTTCQ